MLVIIVIIVTQQNIFWQRDEIIVVEFDMIYMYTRITKLIVKFTELFLYVNNIIRKINVY